MAGRSENDERDAREGRRVMIVLAGTGILWVLATEIGKTYDWPMRVSAFFDILALAGFALGLWMTYQLWRRRGGTDRNDGRND
ncbi:MAG: DUF5337 domain-containing protein [Rubellimicrobium sp.]|nr:DUF5337 domain-containing protein [Rubellimicrobium sp.]